MRDDPWLKAKQRPNFQSDETLIWNNDTIFHVTYCTDSLGWRISEKEILDTIVRKNKHAIFLGCSFTFGRCLEFSSTFPFLFEQMNGDYKSYNWGVNGYGPHQIALLFDDRVNIINRTTVNEQDGFALYTYIHDHLSRAYGGQGLSWFPPFSPNVSVVNDSLIVSDRSEKLKLFARIYKDFGIVKFLGISVKYPHTEQFYKRFADIVSYSAKKYWKINPQGDFYVGIYPDDESDLTWTQYLDPRIKVLKVDVPPDFKQNKNKYFLEHDGHPTKKMNDYYVKEITKLMAGQQ
jgi:hypothetical protein